ncbi:MAG: glycosyltransferase [Candidatus Delongbacteria bacterium]|nr:glycosyltransferase [Candidatus Delongbacteria bacterium]MBN2836036.1 glycosyltransferase [Candidatus Delongbacteria bacterium]
MIYFKIFYLIVSAFYVWYCFHFLKGISKTKTKKLTLDNDSLPYLSVVIPARNEEKVIERTVKSLDKQNYPKDRYKIIIVNDRSTDQTPTILNELKNTITNLKVITITDKTEGISPKKHALWVGVNESDSDYIVSSDADCIYNPDWLRIYAEYAHEGCGVVAGMSVFYKENIDSSFEKLWQGYNTVDFAAHSFVAAGAMGNGKALTANASNMMFKKSLYLEAGKGATKSNITSGDDFFLIQTAEKNNEKLEFVVSMNHVVRTEPVSSLFQLIEQRARWASKMTNGTPYILTFIYTLFFMYMFTFLYPVAAFFDFFDPLFYLLIIFIKVTCEASFNFYGYGRFGLKPDLRSFLIYQIFNMPMNLIAVFKGNFYGFKWKDEKYRK